MTSERPYLLKRSAVGVVSAYAARSGTPYSAMVEIADRCNEACVHCYQVQGQKGELATAEWEKVFEDLAQMGVMLLTISGGEPTLRSDFLHLVGYARRLRFAVKIYSNALNITQSLAEELGRLAVQEVQISLYSHVAEVHDGVTRVPGSFENVVAATKHLRAAGVHVVLKTPLMQCNADGVSEYIDFVKSLDADYALDPKLNPREDGDIAPRALSIAREAHLSLMREPRLASAPRKAQHVLTNRVCGACNGNVHVEANGELRPCTQWAIPTGQVSDPDGVKSWHTHPVAQAIRELTWQSLPGCRVCDLRQYCKRCFANAQREVGDALMPYPNACRGARWNYEFRHGAAPEIEGLDEANEATSIGPYRQTAEGHFRSEAVQLSPADLELKARHPWLTGAAPAPATGRLVQLRRRGVPGLTRHDREPSSEGSGP